MGLLARRGKKLALQTHHMEQEKLSFESENKLIYIH